MLTVERRSLEDIVVLDLEGPMDGGDESLRLHQEVKQLLDDGKRKILLNLEQVPWVNSLGLGCLIASFVSSQRAGGKLKICCPDHRVTAILSVSHLVPDIFPCYESYDEAIGSPWE